MQISNKIQWATLILTFCVAAGTIWLAITNSMTLATYRKELQESNYPNLRIDLCSKPPEPWGMGRLLEDGTALLPTEGGGYRIAFSYFTRNESDFLAYNFYYTHWISTDTCLKYDTTFSDRYNNIIIWPNELIHCGIDYELAQNIIDLDRKGETVYRHAVICFEDKLKNKYAHHAIWRLNIASIDSLGVPLLTTEPPSYLRIDPDILVLD